jgi:hypothetical protein
MFQLWRFPSLTNYEHMLIIKMKGGETDHGKAKELQKGGLHAPKYLL